MRSFLRYLFDEIVDPSAQTVWLIAKYVHCNVPCLTNGYISC